MHTSHLFGASIALAVLGWLLTTSDSAAPVPPPPATTLPADGHYVLVVEGDRNGLAITAASHKADAWAGVPKGFDSSWRLRVADARGTVLVEVPLDVARFDTDPAALLRPPHVEGCIVHTAAIGMLVSVPSLATASTYTFVRPDGAGGTTSIGSITAAAVLALAGGGR